eukprot:scaffold34596_cov222-Amphora_coffeaeformis.AAC.17
MLYQYFEVLVEDDQPILHLFDDIIQDLFPGIKVYEQVAKSTIEGGKDIVRLRVHTQAGMRQVYSLLKDYLGDWIPTKKSQVCIDIGGGGEINNAEWDERYEDDDELDDQWEEQQYLDFDEFAGEGVDQKEEEDNNDDVHDQEEDGNLEEVSGDDQEGVWVDDGEEDDYQEVVSIDDQEEDEWEEMYGSDDEEEEDDDDDDGDYADD